MRDNAGKIGLLAEVRRFLAQPRRPLEVSLHFGISESHASNYLNRLMRMGLAEHPARGVWVAR